jgi:hypothetical protein
LELTDYSLGSRIIRFTCGITAGPLVFAWCSPQVHVVDGGDFATDTAADEIAALVGSILSTPH